MDEVVLGSGVCWKLVRRRVVDEMLDVLLFYGDLVNSRGYALGWGQCFRTRTAFHSATSRLRKQGLIARRGNQYGPAQLVAVDTARERLPDFYRAEQFWNRKWNGIWHVLMYDVPETERLYRDSLRTFLKRNRMGCLQLSVWVTPRDIRAEYNDLCLGAQVEKYSFLMEARTLLGRSGQDLAGEAWDFGRLNAGYAWYLQTYRQRMRGVQLNQLPPESLMHTVREELAAFLTVTQDDPLLPRELYPENYLGPRVLAFHKDFMITVGDAGVKQWKALNAKPAPPRRALDIAISREKGDSVTSSADMRSG